MGPEDNLDALLDERLKLQSGETSRDGENVDKSQKDPQAASAALPPGMQRTREYTADELLKEMNRVPLFMSSLDETDGDGGENVELEALRALVYEGTRADIAQNFRDQGTELVRTEKRYREAREYYTKALQALKAPPPKPRDVDSGQGPRVVEIDEEAEAKREIEIEEACLVNRALCNLEMKNYGSCNRDCAAALRLNPKNVKAYYRAASACLALDKIAESLDACSMGLQCDSQNVALQKLMKRSEARRDHLASLERERRDREQRRKTEDAVLRLALKNRGVKTRTTERPPEVPDAAIALQDKTDAESLLSYPVLILYPVHAQTDFIQAFSEDESLSDHLRYILPVPWDENQEYTVANAECYMETVDGGLIKAGKKLSLAKLLGSGKLEVVDGLVKVNVVPKNKTAQWIEEFKTRRGK